MVFYGKIIGTSLENIGIGGCPWYFMGYPLGNVYRTEKWDPTNHGFTRNQRYWKWQRLYWNSLSRFVCFQFMLPSGKQT